MTNKILYDIELYYSPSEPNNNKITIKGEEFHHIKNVMRHNIGDVIYITNGCGNIYRGRINLVAKNKVECSIEENIFNEDKFSNIVFCIPRLKNQDRFEFAIEKCVELGITNFLFFESERTITKGIKLERIQKLLLSAMKQSIRSWLPTAKYIGKIIELKNYEGQKILFDQKSDNLFFNFIKEKKEIIETKKHYFIFGPEGGLSKKEIESFDSAEIMRLTENRLRTETAIITAASIIATSTR